jgi:hypothetical protein
MRLLRVERERAVLGWVDRVSYRGMHRGAGVHLHEAVHMPGVARHLEALVIPRVVQRCGKALRVHGCATALPCTHHLRARPSPQTSARVCRVGHLPSPRVASVYRNQSPRNRRRASLSAGLGAGSSIGNPRLDTAHLPATHSRSRMYIRRRHPRGSRVPSTPWAPSL